MIDTVIAKADLSEECADRPIERVHARPAVRRAVLSQPRSQRPRRQTPPVGLSELVDELIEINAVLELRLVGERSVDVVGLVVGHHRADLAGPVDLLPCQLLFLPLAAVLTLGFALKISDNPAELVDEVGTHARRAFAPGGIDRGDRPAGLCRLDGITNGYATSVVQADGCPAVLTIILARAKVVPR